MKINTDGSSKGNLGHDGIGGIGQSGDGDVVFFFSTYMRQYSNNCMEAFSILHVIEWGCYLGSCNIIYVRFLDSG